MNIDKRVVETAHRYPRTIALFAAVAVIGGVADVVRLIGALATC